MLLGETQLAAALEEELTSAPSLLPSGVLDLSIDEHKAEFVQLLANRLKIGLVIGEPEVIYAQKAARGLRPVPVLPLSVRILYRALARIAQGGLPPLNRSNEAYAEFRNAPLGDDSVRYVALTDVAACYQYIDHDLLESEVVNRTGEAAAAREVKDLLAMMSGRRFGLPQNHGPSHVLADFVLDIPERQLLRERFKVWRYNDDFRLGTASWSEAHRALEELERRLSALGLTLNDEKTVVRTREGYAKLLSEPDDRWKEIQKSWAGKLATYDPYREQVEPPADAGVSVAAAVQVLTEWEADVEKGVRRYGYEAMQDKQVLINAIWTFHVFNNAQGLAFCIGLMKAQPDLTPHVCRYLGKMAANDETQVTEVIDRLIEDGDSFISAWQALWLLDSIRGRCSTIQATWALRLIESDPTGAVAARAALTLAHLGQIEEGKIAHLYGSVREASRPEVVAAVATRTGPSESAVLKAIVDETPENRWIETNYRMPF